MSDTSEPASDAATSESDAAPTESGSEPGPARKVVRTVTPPYGGRPDAEMGSIGWMLFLGVVILFLPLLPILALGWLITKFLDFMARQRGE